MYCRIFITNDNVGHIRVFCFVKWILDSTVNEVFLIEREIYTLSKESSTNNFLAYFEGFDQTIIIWKTDENDNLVNNEEILEIAVVW